MLLTVTPSDARTDTHTATSAADVPAATEPSLTHFDAAGQAHMVDVGGKAPTHRVALASGRIRMQPATLALIGNGQAKKGDVLGIARIAAIQAAKRTADLVPLCHPLPITRVTVNLDLEPTRCAVRCTAQVETIGRTGVEMEALCAVQVGLLTVYDMCKAVDRGMVISDVRVLEKHGGRSGDWAALGATLAAVRLFVRDLTAARDFYARTLGLTLTHDGSAHGYCAFDSAGVQVVVETVQADAPDDEQGLVGRFAGLSFAVADIAAAHAALQAQGVVFTGAPEQQFWGGWLATFRDPAGNELQLVQHPD